jgi:hypothetical protein
VLVALQIGEWSSDRPERRKDLMEATCLRTKRCRPQRRQRLQPAKTFVRPTQQGLSSCVPVNRFCSVRCPASRVRLQLRRKVAKLRRQWRPDAALANSDTRRTLQLRWLLASHVEVGRRPDLSLAARGCASVPRGAQWHGDETPVPTPTAACGADQQAILTCAFTPVCSGFFSGSLTSR